jgi:hypothetical protein
MSAGLCVGGVPSPRLADLWYGCGVGAPRPQNEISRYAENDMKTIRCLGLGNAARV